MKRIKAIFNRMIDDRKRLEIDITGILMALSFLGLGYVLGINENRPPPAYDLPESMWDEIHAYRLCQDNKTCRMFVVANK